MRNKEKEFLCGLLAALFSPPEKEATEEMRAGQAPSFFLQNISSWGGESAFLKAFQSPTESEDLFRVLQNEYDRLFLNPRGASVSLVESFYKSWTDDPKCRLSFAREKGFIMGDAALHLLALYENSGLQVAEEFQSRPDHLAVELEFLSLLYRMSAGRAIKKFIDDHLDWLPQLKEKLNQAQAHPIYSGALEALCLFLAGERVRLEMEDGTKSIH